MDDWCGEKKLLKNLFIMASYTSGALSSSLFNEEAAPKPKSEKKKKKKSKKRTRESSPSSSTSSTTTTTDATAETTIADTSALQAAFAKPLPFNKPTTIVQTTSPKKKDDGSKKNDKKNDEKTLFFGNVPIETTAKSLKRMLVEMLGEGCVESLRFRSVAVAGTKVKEAGNFKLWRKASANQNKYNPDRSTKNAYVVFKNTDIADNAVDLNGHLFNDNHLRVDRIGKKNHKKEDQRRSVFLGNLPFTVEEEQIHQFFARGVSGGEDAIVNVRVIRDRGTNMGIGIGYVEFANDSYVAEAVALNGSQLASRPVRVQRCHKSGNQKNRNASVGRPGKRQKTNGNSGGRDRQRERKPRSSTGRNGNNNSFMGSKAEKGVVMKMKKNKKSKGEKKKKKSSKR